MRVVKLEVENGDDNLSSCFNGSQDMKSIDSNPNSDFEFE